MSDVKQAAANMRRFRNGESFLDIWVPVREEDKKGSRPLEVAYEMIRRDQQLLADAYLAEHDPTPIDAEFVQQLKGNPSVTGGRPGVAVLVNEDDKLVRLIYSDGKACVCIGSGYGSEAVFDLPTRGSFTRLARALGIETNH